MKIKKYGDKTFRFCYLDLQGCPIYFIISILQKSHKCIDFFFNLLKSKHTELSTNLGDAWADLGNNVTGTEVFLRWDGSGVCATLCLLGARLKSCNNGSFGTLLSGVSLGQMLRGDSSWSYNENINRVKKIPHLNTHACDTFLNTKFYRHFKTWDHGIWV